MNEIKAWLAAFGAVLVARFGTRPGTPVDRAIAGIRAAGHAGAIGEEDIADLIADLMHLAVDVEVDPYDAADHGVRYFDFDDVENMLV